MQRHSRSGRIFHCLSKQYPHKIHAENIFAGRERSVMGKTWTFLPRYYGHGVHRNGMKVHFSPVLMWVWCLKVMGKIWELYGA